MWIGATDFEHVERRFIRDYATALCKNNGGRISSSLREFKCGWCFCQRAKIYAEGVKEVLALEEQMQTKFELPA